MAEKARTVPGARGRGPKPKLEHPMQTLGRVLGFVGKKYWLHLIVVVIAIVVSVLSMVQGTLFTKTLIDSYILPLVKTVQAGGTADFSGLIHAITRVALFYACGVLASLLQARVMIYVTQGALRDLRNEMFQHMQTLPIRYFDTHAHGDIMSIYTNDIDTLRQMISQSMPQLLNCTDHRGQRPGVHDRAQHPPDPPHPGHGGGGSLHHQEVLRSVGPVLCGRSRKTWAASTALSRR